MSVHPTLETALTEARGALEGFQRAELAVAAHAAKKALVRTGAILRIMADPAPSGKPHSWSSAEALRDTDRQYGEYKVEETRLAMLRGQAEFYLFTARQRVEYLARTLPPTPEEWLKTARESVKGYGCVHGVPIDVECAECGEPEIIR